MSENATRIIELLTPPEGYVLVKVDSSTKNANILFKLNEENTKDWHLQGEVLNAAGEDTRQELYLYRDGGDFQSLLSRIRREV